jgi:Kef-type K+ transport system membrane component KefB
LKKLLTLLACLLAAPVAYATEGGASHEDPVAPILLALVGIAVGAALGGRLVRKLGQPAVLGELLIGVLVGNVAFWFGEPVITVLREGETMITVVHAALADNVSVAQAARLHLPDSEHTRLLIGILSSPIGPKAILIQQFIDLLSRVAVIILLFLVGLETHVAEMRKVGLTAFLVAVVGVAVPFFLGYFSIHLLMETSTAKAVFIGAILTATSVGITARVFRDLNQLHRTEAKIILGAAVIDDVLGLIILAVVSGLVVTGAVSLWSASWITVKAALFLTVALVLGGSITPRLVRRMARLEIANLKLLFGLGFAFLLSYAANLVGLATIVGAFAAGLVLEEFFFQEVKQEHSLREMVAPLESLIVPVFFVLMGLQVKLETLADGKILAVAAVLTAVAIGGKLVSGLACGRGVDKLSVGIGMMPRGEVGLIFAGIGKGLGVVSDAVFSAVVIMVMVTTLLTPPLLKITLARSEK